MISKYRVMRALFKRKTVRTIMWVLIKTISSKKAQIFQLEQEERLSTSVFDVSIKDIEGFVRDVNRFGAVFSKSLPLDYVDYFVQLASEKPCFIDRDPSKGFYLKDYQGVKEKLRIDIQLAQYLNVDKDPRVCELAQDPFLQLLASKYLGVVPNLMSVNMWWTFPSNPNDEEKSKNAHVFHYDLDDVKFIKFFFYLTDVDEDSGPHVFVKGSNKNIRYKNSWIKSKRFTDEEIEKAYGKENIVHVMGHKGAGLIEDTITIHKGITPSKNARLMLQLEFSIHNFQELSCICEESLQKIII